MSEAIKLTVKVRSGVSADGFETVVTKGDKVIKESRWDYGYTCSYDRKFADERAPYVTDVLQNMIDNYHVNEFSVEAGRNVFAGKDVSPEKVDQFKNNYCTDLQLYDEAYDFTKESDKISACEEYSECYQNQLSSSAEERMKSLDEQANAAGFTFSMTNRDAYMQPHALVKPRFELIKLELDNAAEEDDFAKAVANIPEMADQLSQ